MPGEEQQKAVDERGEFHQLLCPKCGENEMAEIDNVPGLALVHGIYNDATIEWGGETEIDWNRQAATHSPARFVCLSCKDGVEYELDVATRELTEAQEEE
ncbi:MAG: hypothetical protein E3J64_00780 [Anaerolineales bacterium]|nr:MAG: hypothetical protein E3J64_00780 [Anaerolineales bacterium]